MNKLNKCSKLSQSFLLRILFCCILIGRKFDCFILLSNFPPFLKGGGGLLSRPAKTQCSLRMSKLKLTITFLILDIIIPPVRELNRETNKLRLTVLKRWNAQKNSLLLCLFMCNYCKMGRLTGLKLDKNAPLTGDCITQKMCSNRIGEKYKISCISLIFFSRSI